METKQKKKVSNIMLVVVCIMIILYAAADFMKQTLSFVNQFNNKFNTQKEDILWPLN